jgi:uncharacterized protein (DUF1015 family)
MTGCGSKEPVPSFDPFPALTYNPTKVSIEEVVCPPYDVISHDQRDFLAKLSPYQAVHVELPIAEDGQDPYLRAAQLLDSWLTEGILEREKSPSFYAYRMTIEANGGSSQASDHLGDAAPPQTPRSTLGILGALGLEADPTEQTRRFVIPHEQTLPKAKSDRLELLRATRVNTSPIWGLSLTKGLTGTIRAAIGSSTPYLQASQDGVLHELWRIEDPRVCQELSQVATQEPVVLADGHHRYETAISYAKERMSASIEDPGAKAVLAYLVELDATQLAVGAIHRLFPAPGTAAETEHGGGQLGNDEHRPASPEELLQELSKRLLLEKIEPVSSGDPSSWPGNVNAPVLVTKGGTWTLSLDPAQEGELPPEATDSHRMNLALADGALPVLYVHDANSALASIKKGTALGAVLLRPPTIEQIEICARAGRRMPPKTTYFYPKPLTGMAFRPL